MSKESGKSGNLGSPDFEDPDASKPLIKVDTSETEAGHQNLAYNKVGDDDVTKATGAQDPETDSCPPVEQPKTRPKGKSYNTTSKMLKVPVTVAVGHKNSASKKIGDDDVTKATSTQDPETVSLPSGEDPTMKPSRKSYNITSAKKLKVQLNLAVGHQNLAYDKLGDDDVTKETGSQDPEAVSLPPVEEPMMQSGLHQRRKSYNIKKLKVPLTLVAPRRKSLGDALSEEGEMARLEQPKHLLSPSSPSLWSEIDDLEKRRGSTMVASDGVNSDGTSVLSESIALKLKDLARRFSLRTEKFKEKTVQPPTPSTDETKSAISKFSEDQKDEKPTEKAIALDEHLLDEEKKVIDLKCCKLRIPANWKESIPKFTDTIESQSKLYLVWLMVVSAAFMYNCMAVPARAAFSRAYYFKDMFDVYDVFDPPGCNPLNDTACFNSTLAVRKEGLNYSTLTNYYEALQTEENRWLWWIADYTCDLIYLLDIFLVQGRIKFLKDGLLVEDVKPAMKHYFRSARFRVDIASMVPLDILYLIPQLKFNPIVRLPRMLRFKIYWEFFDRLDQVAKNGYIIRVIRTLFYMIYLIHVEGCGYYAMSAYEGLNRNKWVYSGRGNAYIRCIYLTTKTSTSIGNNPRPTNRNEFMFMTMYWLSGVFVFAVLTGQIRDIFQSAGAAKTNYRTAMDNTLSYMQNLNLPSNLQNKVRVWFTYNWDTQKTLNENTLLEVLPKILKSDIAISVHLKTLSKVQLFQDCEKNLLYDLVLKLKPVLFLPGDYICRKGEVGTEMYIIQQGQVDVVGGPNDSIVFVTLHEGSVFGEISLLALSGGNRRTANVRSKGFSNLFILSKIDFENAMSDYPEAHKILKKKAKKILNKNAKKEEDTKAETEEIIRREETPKLLKTVVQMVDKDSAIHRYLNTQGHRGSMAPSMFEQDLRDVQSLQSKTVDDEEDEILIVERTERPLTADEFEEYEKNGRESVTSVKSGGSLASLKSAINSVLDSPYKRRDIQKKGASEEAAEAEGGDDVFEEAQEMQEQDYAATAKRAIKGILKNKVTPQPHGSPKKKESTSSGSARVAPSDAMPMTPRTIISLGAKRGNKVGPSGNFDEKDSQIPLENRVTCDVVVHREKTPSIDLTSTRGLPAPSAPEEQEDEL